MLTTASPCLPIIICIDIEPDERAIDPRKPRDWLGFEETLKYFARLRPSLALATQSPARFNWYLRMDPQISRAYGSGGWAVTRYREFFSQMRAARDELGLHPHAWRWDEPAQQWVADFANQPWIEHCVRRSFAEFEACFGRPCRSIRFGDRWLNDETARLIEHLGARYDLTIEPGRTPQKLLESFTGSLPDYTRAPRHHYRPSKSDFLRPGGVLSRRKLWMIPVSTASLDWAVSPVPAISGASCERPSPTDTAYEGWFDHVDQRWIVGWIYDARRPDETLHVDIYDYDKRLGRYAADIFRSDLLLAGKGSGAHGFYIPIPRERIDGRLHRISVRAAQADFELGNSPREIVWAETQARDDSWTLNLSENSSLFCRLFDSLIDVQQVSHLALVVRTDALLHRKHQIYIERNLGYILSHPLARSFAVTVPAEAMRILQRRHTKELLTTEWRQSAGLQSGKAALQGSPHGA